METLKTLAGEMEQEVRGRILPFWMNTVRDPDGGYYGLVSEEGIPDPHASKGGTLQARVVWTFSHAFQLWHEPAYLEAARHGWEFFLKHIWDKEYGGIYWLVDFKGQPLDSRKLIFANAYALYAMSEYAKAFDDAVALELAVSLFRLLDRVAYDDRYGGWFDGFDRQWQPLSDTRISPQDLMAEKSMNSHLHLLEAFTTFARVWRDEVLLFRLRECIDLFLNRIMHPENDHFRLFFDREWHPLSEVVSFGHDIEGSWLLVEAAEVLGDETLLSIVKARALQLVGRVLAEGLDEDGALMNGGQKDWWLQAETVIGCVNAYQISGDSEYLRIAEKTWHWIQTHLHHPSGEWKWGTSRDLQPQRRPLVDFWKCPYHNSRMCFEVIQRSQTVE
ncbi:MULTISPECIES: AGE family epimerase/isomerase [Anaerolinea]|uniref:AGE family epimerase/isomerase n=1 Tax=Anaerolinea TaxID=233189 RepID=UPI002613468E|nr:AGE family epimerase/isomerase [Anaerolinea thermophila]